MEKSFENIIKTSESLGWSVTDLRDTSSSDEGKEIQLEFQKHSPAGEDFSFVAEGDNPEGIIDEIVSYCESFITEDHIAMWIEARQNKVNGVPSIKELVVDADAIEEMLQELAEAVSQ